MLDPASDTRSSHLSNAASSAWLPLNIVVIVAHSSSIIVTTMGIILAPYDDSMRLGQGYNSFLHAPCVYDAVRINQDRIGQKPASSDGSVSQNVNYSSRFVDKMSDVVKSLNVSAGSSIKNGGIIGSRNSVTVDETKFAASDLNAIVSVKVVNQKTELLEMAQFKAEEGLNLNSESFLKIYGNCFISGMQSP